MSEEKKKTNKQRERKAGDVFAEFQKKLNQKSKQSKTWSIVLKIAWVFVMLIWVGVIMIACQFIIADIIRFIIHTFNLHVNENVAQMVYSAIVSAVTLIIVIFVPWMLAKYRTTRDELGLRGLPTWTDILLAPIGFIVFMIVAVFVLMVFTSMLPSIDWSQKQDVGFNNLFTSLDFVVAFVSLVVVAPIVEEIIFRGWLYGKLRARISAIPAILAVSLLFGVMHMQWNVGVTVFVMSIAMCCMREITGTIWGGILIHMIKNGLAFYMLYVAHMA